MGSTHAGVRAGGRGASSTSRMTMPEMRGNLTFAACAVASRHDSTGLAYLVRAGVKSLPVRQGGHAAVPRSVLQRRGAAGWSVRGNSGTVADDGMVRGERQRPAMAFGRASAGFGHRTPPHWWTRLARGGVVSAGFPSRVYANIGATGTPTSTGERLWFSPLPGAKVTPQMRICLPDLHRHRQGDGMIPHRSRHPCRHP